MPHATKSLPQILNSQPPLTRQNPGFAVSNGLVRQLSSEFGAARELRRDASNSNSNSYSDTLQVHSPEDTNNITNGGTTSPGPEGRTMAVGKAGLGKSGRVIDKLMSENDMLKREIKVAKLNADEHKNAVKMAEGKMEAMIQEYDTKLHDAAINKTLLKRRERQLTELRTQVESEKSRADRAVEREKGWREAMEQLEESSKRKVEEAQSYAALMEGRNKAMTSHWKEQGAEVDRTVLRVGKQIEDIILERRKDDEKINTLQGLCDQQAEKLQALEREKTEMA